MTIRCCVTAGQRFLPRAAKPSALPTPTYLIITLALKSSTMAFRGFPIPKSTGDHAPIALKNGPTFSGSHRVGCLNCNAAAPKGRSSPACLEG